MQSVLKKFKFTPCKYYKCDQPITFILVHSESSAMHTEFVDAVRKLTYLKVISKEDVETCEPGFMYLIDWHICSIAELCQARNMCIRRHANNIALVQLMDPKFSVEMSPFVINLFDKFIAYDPHRSGRVVNFVLQLLSLIM